MRIGVDTGGTFTDFVVLKDGNVSVLKVPSTPDEPEKAIIEGLRQVLGESEDAFIVQHGSTVATNTLLERRGAKTVLLTNQGFEDILEIGRQSRPALYSLSSSRPKPLVPSAGRLGVKERTNWDGSVLQPLEDKSLEWLRKKVESLEADSVAVVLLYSYTNPESEVRIGEALASLGKPVSLSHKILPEFREYERTSATVINAYLAPVMASYLEQLQSEPLLERGQLTVMQSSGGSASVTEAAEQPVRTLFSGPAGGVVGAFGVAKAAGFERIITLDMGGTSTDVSLCDGAIRTTREAQVDHLPVPVQTIDIQSVGAGGGSIAWIDSGGLLKVGPQSAGADPGPTCYGKGSDATVTDANVFLGLLDPDWFLGGQLTLSTDRIRPALETLAEKLTASEEGDWTAEAVALGVRQIVNTQMEGAIRLASLEKGYDTRDFSLVSFGGAAGLHACDLARALLIPRVIVPVDPGLLSASGAMRANVLKEASKTIALDWTRESAADELKEAFSPLEDEVRQALASQNFAADAVSVQSFVSLRYHGQSFELEVPAHGDFVETFHDAHLRNYGYSNAELPVEVVTIRVAASGRFPEMEWQPSALEGETPDPAALVQEKKITIGENSVPTRFYLRSALKPGNRIEGAAVVLEYSSTTWIPEDFQLEVDAHANLLITPK